MITVAVANELELISRYHYFDTEKEAMDFIDDYKQYLNDLNIEGFADILVEPEEIDYEEQFKII